MHNVRQTTTKKNKGYRHVLYDRKIPKNYRNEAVQ